jgi:hypothetical protein
MSLEPWQPHESLLQDTILVLKPRQGASPAQIRKHLELDNSKHKMLPSTLKNLVLTGKAEKNGPSSQTTTPPRPPAMPQPSAWARPQQTPQTLACGLLRLLALSNNSHIDR